MNMAYMHAALYRLGLEALHVLQPAAVRIQTRALKKKKKGKKEKNKEVCGLPPQPELPLQPFREALTAVHASEPHPHILHFTERDLCRCICEQTGQS